MTSSRLERTGQLAFIVMCLVITASAARFALMPAQARSSPSTSGATAPPIAVGTPVSLTGYAAEPDKAGRLVLAISPACIYCTQSMPFYRRLASIPAFMSGRLGLNVVHLGGETALDKYLETHQLTPSLIIGLRESDLRISGTPTLVLLDRAGVVLNSWAGLLNDAGEAAVIAAVEGAAR